MWCVPCLQTRPKGTVKPHPSTTATNVKPQNADVTPSVPRQDGGWVSMVRNLVAAALIIAGITTYAIHRKTTNADSPKDVPQEQQPPVPVEAAPAAPASPPQNEDQTLSIVRACGRPSRDYEDSQAGTTWRHLVYGRRHVELVYQRFPGWTYIAATDPRDTVYGEVLDYDEVNRRLPCSQGVLRDLIDH